MILISIIVPVYNGEQTLETLFTRIIETFRNNEEYSVEIIFVYDCGQDNSWQVISRIVDSSKGIARGIKLSRNFGQHNAIICGFSEAKGKFVVTIDEDLQQDPNDILKLLDKQKIEDYDVVYGKFPELNHSAFRNVTSRLLKRMLKIGIPELHPDYSALRLIKTNIAFNLREMQNSYSFLDGYITWFTSHVSSTPISHNIREFGKSSYTVKKLIEHSINIFVTFSNFPIRFLTYSSIFVFLSTIIYSLVIIYQHFIGKISVPGYASLTITIGLGVGFILLGLGIIGEYIYRINLKTTRRPNFVILEKK